MKAADPSGEWSAVQSALERYFLAREQGEAVDIMAACDGDAGLAERVLDVLGRGPDMVVESGEPSADEAPLASFGDFDVVEQIGKGGMGTVYLALQRSLGRQVALKVLDRASLEVPSARLRMRREAELTAHLDHPSIVPVYAVGEVGGVPFIAMKYLQGPSLAEVERPWSPQRAAEIGIALAEALDAAHVHGVVHRDVKPANILLDGKDPVFVDFGLARAQSDPTLTQEGKVAGTLRYMAPERLDAGSPVLDPRVDIYGLGATLYELLAGHEVFAEQTPTALVRSVLARDPAPMKLPGRHHDLETIVLRALAKEPARRFATAREMADDLRRYLRGEPVASRRMSATARAVRLVQRHPRTSLVVAAAMALALVSFAILFVDGVRQRADTVRRLDAAQIDYREGRHERAHQQLTLLAQRHPGDAAIANLLAQARGEVAIDRLLGSLTSRAINIDRDLIEALVAAVGGGTPVAQLGAIIALSESDQLEGARERLAELPPAAAGRRAARAVAALLAQETLPWDLPPMTGDASASEVMLASLALRLAGAPATRVLEELQTARPEQRGASRLVFLEAVARADLVQLGQAADLLRGLTWQEAPATVWRTLAVVQMRLGRLAEAGASLAMISEDSPSTAYVRAQHAFATAQLAGDHDVCAEIVAGMRADPDRDPESERFLAEYDGKSDPAAVPDALARLQRLLESEQLDRIGRDFVRAAMIEVAAVHLPDPFDGGGVVEPAHRRFVRDWSERGAAIRTPGARLVANTWLARSLCCSGAPGDTARGLELFRATAAATPGSARLALGYARAVTMLEIPAGDPIRRMHAVAARVALDEALRRPCDAELALRPGLDLELRYYAWQMAWLADDIVEMARRMPEIEAGIPPGDRENAEQTARWVERHLEHFRDR